MLPGKEACRLFVVFLLVFVTLGSRMRVIYVILGRLVARMRVFYVILASQGGRIVVKMHRSVHPTILHGRKNVVKMH